MQINPARNSDIVVKKEVNTCSSKKIKFRLAQGALVCNVQYNPLSTKKKWASSQEYFSYNCLMMSSTRAAALNESEVRNAISEDVHSPARSYVIVCYRPCSS